MQIKNPANGETIKNIPEDSTAQVAEKLKKAQDFRHTWWNTSLDERKKAIQTFRENLQQNAERLGPILTQEMGKPVTQAIREVQGSDGRIEFFLNNVDRVLETLPVFQHKNMNEEISYEPLGVVGVISAWNFPYFVGLNVLVPALLTGNTVLYKPSEHATLTGLEIVRLLHESGIPNDALLPIVGGATTGQALIDQPVDGLFFTGSYRTGVAIENQVRGKGEFPFLQFELGGKDPLYVCDDADPAKIGAGLVGDVFDNCAQSCCAVERLYVHKDIADEFEKHFVDEARKIKTGDPMDPATVLGPVARADQLAVIEDQVKDATAKGARVALGGNRVKGPGNFFEPTVLLGVTADMKVMREETFGPVIGIQRVSSDEEAISLMKDTEYGLTSSVFTPDETRARKILAQMNTGSVYWNCCDRVSPHLPWTGRKRSGRGVTLSKMGIQTFLRPKAWHMRQI